MNKTNSIFNTAIFQFATSGIHLATSLEILHNESNLRHNNYYNLLGQDTFFPSRMAKTGQTLLGKAPKKLKGLVKKADPNVHFIDKIKYNRVWVNKNLEEFSRQLKSLTNISDLALIKHDSISPGPALANELVSLSRNAEINLFDNQKMLWRLLRSYLEVYSHTLNLIRVYNINRVHIYNGRFLHERASWDAAKQLGCEVLIFETTHNRYQQRIEGFHNRVNNQKVMKDLWMNSDIELSEKIEISSEWFTVMKSSINPFMIKESNRFITDKKFFVYFSNSDDEVIGFWDEWKEPLGNQLTVVNKLIDIFSNQEKYNLVIRLHPNLLNRPQSVVSKWESLNTKRNSILIQPHEKISSYELLDDSIGIINFGSTIGIEAAYYEKPVLVLADCKYDELQIADKLTRWDEIESWIEQAEFFPDELIAERKMNSLIFGYYFHECGTRFAYTELSKSNQLGAWNADYFLGVRINEFEILKNYRRLIMNLKFWLIKGDFRFEK
jgi:hypothetical protein